MQGCPLACGHRRCGGLGRQSKLWCRHETTSFDCTAGGPEEGKLWREVAWRHADTGGLTGWDGVGKFTDDTQMGLALAKSLVRISSAT